MARKKGATKIFDPELFGRALREKRKIAGYSSTKVFSSAMQEKTGVFIDFDTLLKYERGEREPDVTKLIAITITLFGDKWPMSLVDMLRGAFPNSVDTSGDVGQVRALNAVLESQVAESRQYLELLLLRRIVVDAQAKGQLTPSPALKELEELQDRQSEAFFSQWDAD